MCGRFTLFSSPSELQSEFDLRMGVPDDMQQRYNIAPSQDVLAIIQADNERRAGDLRWGLIPSWSKDAKFGSKLINARAETIDSRPSFKRAFKSRRCIIPTSGFYEWRKLEDGTKQPYFIYPASDNGLFAFAGLWEKWIDEKEQSIYSCTIITTEANEIMEPLHHRMPVLLDREDYSTWLDKESDLEDVKDLLLPYKGHMNTKPVSTLVNSPKYDSVQCIDSVAR